ncbi:ABC transporter permease [Bordetella sp. 2513F-2]
MEERSPLKITRAVVFALVLREMLTRFGARRMGAFWMLFEPIAHVLLIMVIFGVIRDREVPGMDFPVYLATGLIPFFLMRNIALRLMDGISANQALFAYQQIKPMDTLVARTIVEFSLSACVYTVVILGMGFWFGYDISMADPLRWFVALATGVALSFALGIIFCIYTQFFPGAKTFIRLSFFFLYLMSCVIFPIWAIPTQYLEWVMWNPYLHIIDVLRSSVFEHYPIVHGIDLFYAMKVALVLLFLAMALYRMRRQEMLAL